MTDVSKTIADDRLEGVVAIAAYRTNSAEHELEVDASFAIREDGGVRLVIEKAAARRLQDMAPGARRRLRERLDAIAADPFARHGDAKALRGGKDMFRLRRGDWRAIYLIDREREEMRVIAIEPRGSAYR